MIFVSKMAISNKNSAQSGFGVTLKFCNALIVGKGVSVGTVFHFSVIVLKTDEPCCGTNT